MTMRRRQALKAGVGALAGIVGTPAIAQAQAALKLPLSTAWPDGNFHVVILPK